MNDPQKTPDSDLTSWQQRWQNLDELPCEEQIAQLENVEAELRAQLEAGRQNWGG